MEKTIDNSWLINQVQKLKGEGRLKGDGVAELSELLDYNKGDISSFLGNKKKASKRFVEKFANKFGLQLDSDTAVTVIQGANVIPLFEDVNTIGGFNLQSSGVGIKNQASEYINAGGWFKGATAAIRHYNDSMREYPSGCILALKEMVEIDFIWGTNYCIEYGEDFSRVTKRVQRGDDKEEIKAYSTNTETYPDGRMIHEPLDIKVNRIKRLFQVLGVVIKERSTSGDMAML